MLSIPAALIAAKNQLTDGGPAIELLEISMTESSQVLYLTSNDEDVVWNATTWTRFPFKPGDVTETSEGDIPRLELQVSNVSRVIQGYLEDTENGLVGDTITYRIVHGDNLATSAFITEKFTVQSARCDPQWVTFTLSCKNFFNYRFPRNYFRYNLCRWRDFGGAHCLYSGTYTTCSRSFNDCIQRDNEARYGGFPGMLGGFFDVSTST